MAVRKKCDEKIGRRRNDTYGESLPGFSQMSRAAKPNPIPVGGDNNCW
jgi:hypothetical protein